MKKSILSAIVFLTLLRISPLLAQGYQLDPSFDEDGIKVLNSAGMHPIFGHYEYSWDEAHCVAVDENDKILVGGYTASGTVRNNFTVYRFNEDGTPDNTFGNSGKAIVNVDVKGGVATSIKVMPDGKILVAGYALNSSDIKQIVLVRLNSNGTLDTSFGTNGFSKGNPIAGNTLSIRINDLLVAQNGKIVITAYIYTYEYYVFHYLRFNSNGTFDTTLDSDGMYSKGTKFQSFGSTFNDTEDLMILGVYEGSKGVFKLGSDGIIDSTYGFNGVIPVNDFVPRGIFNYDSYITAAGYLTFPTSTSNILIGYKLVRLEQNGSRSSLFGSNGEVSLEYYVNGSTPQFNKIKFINDQYILIGNTNSTMGSGKCDNSISQCYSISHTGDSEDFWLLSLNEDGTIDNTFGTSGTHIIPISTIADDEALDVTMDSQGRVIAVGYVMSGDPYYRDMVIVRLASTTTNTVASERSPSVSVYPNPGSGVFKLRLNSKEPVSEIRIINPQGLQIQKVSARLQGEVELDLSNHPPGMYLTEVVRGDKVERVKLIKE